MTEASSPPDVTELLLAWGGGDASALERLVPLVHQELTRVARRLMAGENRAHTLQPTALVHEAYIRLIDLSRVRWQDRAHFIRMSARVMRQILVDHARTRLAHKRGGADIRVPLEDVTAVAPERAVDLIALDRALDDLAAMDPRKGEVVELKFFGGLSNEEAADVLQISPETVKRDWRVAKAWLMRKMEAQP